MCFGRGFSVSTRSVVGCTVHASLCRPHAVTSAVELGRCWLVRRDQLPTIPALCLTVSYPARLVWWIPNPSVFLLVAACGGVRPLNRLHPSLPLLYLPAMAPTNLIGRIAQWLANEIIVKGLGSNPAFQRFALRSAESAQALARQATDAAAEAAANPSVRALREEGTAAVRAAAERAAALRRAVGDVGGEVGGLAAAVKEEVRRVAAESGAAGVYKRPPPPPPPRA